MGWFPSWRGLPLWASSGRPSGRPSKLNAGRKPAPRDCQSRAEGGRGRWGGFLDRGCVLEGAGL
eukprot:8661907-Pyramimonas_sp.AAC.1